MSVRAKFTCNEVKDGQISLSAVYDSNPDSENGRFFKYTPWGQLKMGIVNELALDQFKEGEEYYLDFTKVSNNG